MIRPLEAGDTAAALALLRKRPLENLFLEHVVRSGVLGRAPGFWGAYPDGRLLAVLMIGPQGGVALEVADARAYGPLAACAAEVDTRPRHIVGCEDVTAAFWEQYRERADPLIWTRREPFYSVDRDGLRAPGGVGPSIEPARARDLDELIANSGRQHIEDLGDDRYAADPESFRRRHQRDIDEQRWWVLRERQRIVFQVHVGPENAQAVQIGGVITAPDLRGRGLATRGVAAIAAHLLERRPGVVLLCAEDNAAARRVYERVGFAIAFHNRSYLLETPPCPGVYA
jgi:RimJ/RimL family protein N-acetyltransferase